MNKNTINDFSKIVLLNKEFMYLICSKFYKVPKNEHTYHLYQLGFLQPIETGNIGKYGNKIYTNKFNISKEGKRYLKFIRKEKFNRFLTPIIVAVPTTIATNIVLYLLQYLLT